MSDFTPLGKTGRPVWTGIASPATTYRVLSSTGQVQVLGGFGQGGFGEGGFGTGVTVSINTKLSTAWTSFTEK